MRFTIKLKLAIAFGVAILLAAVMGVVGVANLNSLNSAITDIVKGPAARLAASNNLGLQVQLLVQAEKNMIMTTNSSEIGGYNDRII